MTMKCYDFKFNTLNKEKFFKIIKDWNNYFEPNLSDYVENLEEYAEKIYNNATIIECYKEKELVGLLGIYLNTKTAFITHFVIKPKFQKMGLGKKMLNIAIKKAHEKKCNQTKLECFDSALKFYIKQGFIIEGKQNNKYTLALTLPLVSVCCVTYNEKDYIRQCLDSMLEQKTNFPFEILIHDDASTDGTEEIIREYQAKYPDIIKPLYEKENQFSKGVTISKTYNYPRVKGQYVAICEGDDYWTDENKLQKQVDFLDANPDYTVCFHKIRRHFETGIKEDDFFPTQKMIDTGFDFETLLKYNFIQTNSVMYRWNAVENPAKEFPNHILPGDWYLHLMFAKKGKISYLDEEMGVYRINTSGLWYNAQNNRLKLYDKQCFNIMNFHKNVYKNIAHNDYYYLLMFKVFKEILYIFIKNGKKIKALQFLFINIQIPIKATRIYNMLLKSLF